MKYALFILLIVSFQTQAQTNKFILKTSINDGLKKVEVDLNKDGKVDRIEIYRGETLISLDRDSKFTGKFDESTTYFEFVSATKPIEVTKKDTNGDGKVDRIESVYKDIAHDLLIVSTQIDSTFNGKFDKKFTTHSKLSQKKDEANCISDKKFEDLKILKLTTDIGKVKMSLEGGFYKTDWGYKIHQSCLDKWGANVFPNLLKSTMSKGFKCLGNLATENAKKNLVPNGALNNLKGLEYLTSTSSVSIVCNEKDYSWTGIAAHASVSPDAIIKESGVKHPFISVNETDPKIKTNPTDEEKSELSATLFHEQLHNLGIRHGESVEFPYACETCCISSKAAGAEKENACKICSGVYTSISDKNYLNDLIAWGKTSYQEERSAKAIIKYQKEFPQDRWALFAYADSSAGVFSPVGIQMSKILKNKFKNLTKEEEDHLKNVKSYGAVKNLTDPATSRFSKMVAEAHITRYFDGDAKKALDDLDKNKAVIKDLLKKESTATKDNKYILEDVKKKLNDLLTDIWLNSYPDTDSPESYRAYKMLKDTGLIK